MLWLSGSALLSHQIQLLSLPFPPYWGCIGVGEEGLPQGALSGFLHWGYAALLLTDLLSGPHSLGSGLESGVKTVREFRTAHWEECKVPGG